MSNIIQDIEKEFLKTDLPEIFPGDTVKVMVRIKEGNKERLQGYEGVVIRTGGSGTGSTFTVRRVFQGVGIERIFLLHSPKLDSIEILRRGRVRRSRLYYMRGRSGKSARIREKTTGYAAKLAQREKADDKTPKKKRAKKKRKGGKTEQAKAAAAEKPKAEKKPEAAPEQKPEGDKAE